MFRGFNNFGRQQFKWGRQCRYVHLLLDPFIGIKSLSVDRNLEGRFGFFFGDVRNNEMERTRIVGRGHNSRERLVFPHGRYHVLYNRSGRSFTKTNLPLNSNLIHS